MFIGLVHGLGHLYLCNSWYWECSSLLVSQLFINLFPLLLIAHSVPMWWLVILLFRRCVTCHDMISTLYALDVVFPTEPAAEGQLPIRFAVHWFIIWTMLECYSDSNVNLHTVFFAALSHRWHLFYSILCLLFSEDAMCGVLNKNGPQRLIYLNTCHQVGGILW